MASLRILVPVSTTNYVKNPSLFFDTTGYTAFGSTLTRSLERARFGISSLKVVTNGSAVGEGFYYRINWLAGIQGPLTASAYVRGAGKVRIRLTDNLGKNYASQPVFLDDTTWMRLNVTGRCSGGNDVRLWIETSDRTAKALTIYCDGMQVEPHEYMTTYCDGDQSGCRWNILEHGSLSTRSADTRSGGRWVSLAGCDRDEDNIYMTVLGGFGAAPIRNNIQSYADAPGSYYQNTKVLNRSLTVSFHVKSPDPRGNLEKSLRDLHALRKSLFDIIRPDRVAGGQEFILEYQDGETPLYLSARYEAGLEGEWDIRNRWAQSFPVRFLCVSPFAWDDNYETNALTFKTRSTINYAMRRTNGEWFGMNGGLNNYVYNFAFGKRGELIAVGTFTLANSPTITAKGIAYWDGSSWLPFGTGALTGTFVKDVAVAPNGDIYVVGDFTNIGGVACNYIAKWNGSAWSALGTGLGARGMSVVVAPNGYVYVGGNFTTAGGVTARYFAWWDGSSWHGAGTYLGVNQEVLSVAISADGGRVYLAGVFTDEYGSPGTALNYVAEYVPVVNQFYAIGDGFDAQLEKIFVSPGGLLYAGGTFTASGTQTMLYIAYWDGAAWHGIGEGADNRIVNIDVDQYGNILAAGNFTRIGNVDARGVALYNGTSWVSLDASVGADCNAAKWGANGDIYISPEGTLADYGAITTFSVYGTAEVSPLIYVSGPCTLRWLENQTTQKRLYLDLDILSGEEIFIDLGIGKITSLVRGDLSYAIAAGSDLRAWTLLPGDNRIAAFMLNDISAVCRIYYAPRYWSIDSTADGISL